MREINWKSLSLSLIISTILNGIAISTFIIQYMDIMSSLFHEILSNINNSNTTGKIAYTIAEGKSIPFWVGILIISLSYVFVAMISYFLIELQNRRKK